MSNSDIAARFGSRKWKVLDLESGRTCEGTCANANIVGISPDGQLLLTQDLNDFAGYDLWGIAPRKPGGLILAAMIAEVSLFIAWTVWRRRHSRRRFGIQPQNMHATG
jgi:hypothetical protein